MIHSLFAELANLFQHLELSSCSVLCLKCPSWAPFCPGTLQLIFQDQAQMSPALWKPLPDPGECYDSTSLCMHLTTLFSLHCDLSFPSWTTSSSSGRYYVLLCVLDVVYTGRMRWHLNGRSKFKEALAHVKWLTNGDTWIWLEIKSL